jgi:hypothetical protein
MSLLTTILHLLYWVPVFLPGLTIFLIWWGYNNRMLKLKLMEVRGIMSRGNIIELYAKAFMKPPEYSGTGDGETSWLATIYRWIASTLRSFLGLNRSRQLSSPIDKLFNLYYQESNYIYPLIVSFVITTAFSAITLVRIQIPLLGMPLQVENLIQRLPGYIFAAVGMTFVMSIYDMLIRYRTINLSPISIHFIWWRLISAPLLAFFLTLILSDNLKMLAGLIVGILPTRELLEIIASMARKVLNQQASSSTAEGPTLQNIQGMTIGVIEALNDEGIFSTSNLAMADPIKLLMRTNLDWKFILDIIDRAILFNYLGAKYSGLAPSGIRGAIELAVVQLNLGSDDPNQRQWAQTLVLVIAKKLGLTVTEVRSLAATMFEDIQVRFIWNLWGDA